MLCSLCGRQLDTDTEALCRKLMGRGTLRFLCIDCLAAEYGVTVQKLRQKIEEYRASGCMLFIPPKGNG